MAKAGWWSVVFLGISAAIAVSVILVLLGLVYFVVNLWIVKFGAELLGYNPDSNAAVIAAALLTVSGLIGGMWYKKW
jgi:hypothetical protein